ncbi:MAG: hypothetical protein JXB03_05705 [Spirochaetales bacterium]|nr:hypothetical protein [Spirochaetales bacterium]
MGRMKLYGRVSLVCVLIAALFSCATLQEDQMVNTADDILETELEELEKLIIPLDMDPSSGNLAKARAFTDELESRPVQDTVFIARLAAWSGRLFVLENKPKEARDRLETALSLSPGEPAAAVLQSRLTADPAQKITDLETAGRLSGDPGLIILEKALVHYAAGSYREAVAGFDESLQMLPSYYAQTYGSLRDQAWNLVNLDEETSPAAAELAGKSEITWAEALDLTQESTSLLDFLTGGDTWQTAKIFPAVMGRGLLPAPEVMELSPQTRVVRGTAAWFLWHLNSVYRAQPGLLIMYSSVMFAEDASPIDDVPITAPWFDSVLGCVEWEFMTLADGKNFIPWQAVSGSDFYQMLKSLE